MAGVEQLLNLDHAIALFAIGDVVTGKNQVVNNGAGIGPTAEQVVIFEKGVVAVAGMGHHQRLHGNGVLLHQVSDTRVGVDHNLVGQPLLPVLIEPLGLDKLFTKRPVGIVNRHSDAGVGVHHLFGGDDFDLVGIGIKPVEFSYPIDLGQVGIKQFECPVGSIAETGGVLIHGVNRSH